MRPVILDINDAALRVVDGDETAVVAPGFALAEDGHVALTGRAAATESRRRPRNCPGVR